MNEEIKNVAIQQINIGYNAHEDRVLLKIGMSDDLEVNLWLTRKAVKALWQLLQDNDLAEAVAPDTESPQAKSFAQDNAAQPLDFSEAYKNRSPVNGDEIFLAHACHLVQAGHALPSLEFVCTNGRTIKVVLNQNLSLALVNMLQVAAKEADWDLVFSEQPSLLSPVTANTIVH